MANKKRVTIYSKSGNALEIREDHKKQYIGKGYSLKNPIQTKEKDK